jgi:phosphohistidine phosphatase SixA
MDASGHIYISFYIGFYISFAADRMKTMRTLPHHIRLMVVLLLGCFVAAADAGAGQRTAPELWDLLKSGGHVALIRHARAPGFGDPPGFRLADCATQRNLSDEGREQARRIGQAFRDNGVAVDNVLSSEWCRCLETAALLGLGPVERFPALNSFFEMRENRDPQMKILVPWVRDARPEGVFVLVTHQVVISALTGEGAGSGEIVVVRPRGDTPGDGTIEVLGTIPPP